MTRRLHLPAALAALLAALPCASSVVTTQALGRFVECPTNAAPSCLCGEIPIGPGTYRALCALGDMALERTYVTSPGGWASAPEGYALSAMAEEGWETPSAARHAQLYDLVYARLMEFSPRLDLPCGAKVYPLASHDGLAHASLGGLAVGWQPMPTIDIGCLGFAAASCGAFGLGEGDRQGSPLFADLSARLSAHGFVVEAPQPEAARAAAVGRLAAYVRETYPAELGGISYDYRLDNYVARGGIKAGDPLRLADPLAANRLLGDARVVPVLVPPAAMPPQTNRACAVALSRRVSRASVRAEAERQMRAGSASLSDALPAEAAREEVPDVLSAGAPRGEDRVVYRPDTRCPRVWAVVRRTDETAAGEWVDVGEWRVSYPSNGTLHVSRWKAPGTTSYELLGAGVEGGTDLVDVKTNTVVSCEPVAPSVGWPHASSAPWVESVQALAFAGRTRRWDGLTPSAGYDPYGSMDECGSAGPTPYDSETLNLLVGEPYHPSPLGEAMPTLRVRVDPPDLSPSKWTYTGAIRTVFTPDPSEDDPDPQPETRHWAPKEDDGPKEQPPPDWADGDQAFDPARDWEDPGGRPGDDDECDDPSDEASYPRTYVQHVRCGVEYVRVEREATVDGGYERFDVREYEMPTMLLIYVFGFMRF